MMCLYPKLIKNKKYTSTKKNGGIIPPIYDERTRYVPVGCQNCIECKKQKARAWRVRLLEDIKTHKNGKFITLTFSNESIATLTGEIYKISDDNNTQRPEAYNLDNEIATLAIRRFLERYRKLNKQSIRHWLVTELGHNGTENIHLHGIIWTDKDLQEIELIWQYGFMWKGNKLRGKIINYVNEQTVNYITKYVTKIDDKHPLYKSKILTSPGIGHNYITNSIHADWNKNKYKNGETIESYRTRTGHQINLPIYWRNKIYTEEEREKLWLQKLDKLERWVLGQKIDVSTNEEEYNTAIKYARIKNKKLGYGNDEKNVDQEQYERHKRIIMQQTRIKNAKDTKIN